MVPDAGGLRMIAIRCGRRRGCRLPLACHQLRPGGCARPARASDAIRVGPEGPAQACGNATAAPGFPRSGAITAETPRDFEAFAKKRKIDGATLALDSDGGSVLGALALGRTIRKLGMTTTVGKTIDLTPPMTARSARSSRRKAYCESMCAFVLLAGVERRVPAEARVMVHQIWLGDRRDDPTAANYSAEDLVVVQRDIGRLARYTVEMGGGVDLLEIALKIPPWEPMRLLSRDELRTMKVDDRRRCARGQFRRGDDFAGAVEWCARTGQRQGWAMVTLEKAGRSARPQPSADGRGRRGRHLRSELRLRRSRDATTSSPISSSAAAASRKAPAALSEVEISLAGKSVQLKVVTSRPPTRPWSSIRSPADVCRSSC